MWCQTPGVWAGGREVQEEQNGRSTRRGRPRAFVEPAQDLRLLLLLYLCCVLGLSLNI